MKVFCRSDKKPIILTNLIFNYILTYYNPLLYFELIDARSVPFGKDLLPYVKKPEKYFLIQHILEQIPNILIFSQRDVFLTNHSNIKVWNKSCVSIIVRSMYIRLHFDKGICPEGYTSISSNLNDEYSLYFDKINELEKNNYDDSDMKGLYKFFRQLSYDIHYYVSDSDIADSLK